MTSRIVSGTNLAETITTAYTCSNYGDWVWRLTGETLSGTVSGTVRQTSYGYASTTGNMTSMTRDNSSGDDYVKTMTYDQYGNVLTEQEGAHPAAAYVYDGYGLFPVTITNPLGQVTARTYNYIFGLIAGETDPNGNTTGHAYDAFGRPAQIIYPDGGRKIIEYHDDVLPRYTVTRILEKDSPAEVFIDTREYLDGFGRNLLTVTYGENGAAIGTLWSYDHMGRNDRTDGPQFAQNDTYPIVFETPGPYEARTFDDRGRPMTVTRPNGTGDPIITAYSYAGLDTTLTDPDGHIKVERKDILGRLVEVRELGSISTGYAYNAAEDLVNVTDSSGNITTMGYNTLGLKTSMIDPDMGSWTYTYDQCGNLVTQTDAKSQTVTCSYDDLNRILAKTFSTGDPAVTYVYDLPGENRIGRLTSANQI